MSYQGKVALITGGVSGIGAGLAEKLQSEGATVILADRNDALGKTFTETLNTKRAGSAFFHKVDVADWESQVALFKAALEQTKRIDYIYANAGIAETLFLPYTSAKEIQWVKPDISVLNVNLIGVQYTTSLAAQVFRTQELVDGFRGKIIVTCSVAGVYPLTYLPSYTASKFGAVGFVRALGELLKPEGITVNGIAPAIADTPLLPEEFIKETNKKGVLTSKDAITEALTSFLGTSTESGVIKQIIKDQIIVAELPQDSTGAIAPTLDLMAFGGKLGLDAEGFIEHK